MKTADIKKLLKEETRKVLNEIQTDRYIVLYYSKQFGGGWDGGGEGGMASDTNDLKKALKWAMEAQKEEGGTWKVYDTKSGKDVKQFGKKIKESVGESIATNEGKEYDEPWFYAIADEALKMLQVKNKKWKKYEIGGMGPGNKKNYMDMKLISYDPKTLLKWRKNSRGAEPEFKVHFNPKTDRVTKIEMHPYYKKTMGESIATNEGTLTKDDLIHKVLDQALLDPQSGQNKASVDGLLYYIQKAGVKGITKGDIIKHAKSMSGIKVQGGNLISDVNEELNEAKFKWPHSFVVDKSFWIGDKSLPKGEYFDQNKEKYGGRYYMNIAQRYIVNMRPEELGGKLKQIRVVESDQKVEGTVLVHPPVKFRGKAFDDIEDVNEEINEAFAKLDLNDPYYVIAIRGSIGSGTKNQYGGGEVIRTFDEPKAAKYFAARRRKQLTPGEKKYYQMNYKVVKGDKKKVRNIRGESVNNAYKYKR